MSRAIVDAVGAGVTRFRVGDAVFAESDQGGFAELVAVPERFVGASPGHGRRRARRGRAGVGHDRAAGRCGSPGSRPGSTCS